MPRDRRFPARQGLLAVLCLVAVALVAPTGLLRAQTDQRNGVGDREFAPLPRQDERLQQWRDSEERRRAKRQSKEAKEERKRSKTKFRGQSRQEALATARQEQPVLIETPKHKPLTLKAGEQVERFHGEFGAQIDGPGGPSVVDSALPLRSGVGDGPKRLADYSLEDHGATLSPDNPIVATEIAKDVQGGLRIGEWAIGLETASSATADVVEDRAFFANALPDIDYVVLPTATGAHLSLQVRSADAPEQAVLPLDLPAGVQARLVEDEQPPAGASETGGGSSASGDLPPGSVEIVKEGTVIASIARPVAWGADNEPLEVSYSLRGKDLVLSFPHRSADVQYPLLVDPLAADRFRVNEQGQPVSNSSFLIARSGGEAAAWTYGESTPGFPHGPGQGPGAYDHNGFLWVSNLDRNRFWYPDGSYGQWTWQAPRTSFIKRADFNNVYFNPTFQYYPAAMCLAEAVFSVVTWNWESGYWDDARGFSGGPNSSPFIGGPAPNGSCNTQTNNGKAHTIYNPTPGNIAVFRFFSYGQGYKYNHSNAEMYGGAVYLDDNDVPSVTDATSSPGGWVRSGTLTTRVNSTDRGLGTIVHAIDIPIEGPNPTGRRVQFTGACDRGRISRCPERFDHTFSYNSEDVLPDDPAYPATLGPQRIREGINTIEGDTYDATYKPTHFQAGQIKIDRSVPNFGSITGVNEGELLRDRDYTITGGAADALSGAKEVEITLDGVRKAYRSDCPANTNKCFVSFALKGDDPALAEGTHTLRVTARDQVGNGFATVATRTFKVDRKKPTFEADGSLLPIDTRWVGRGEQDLIIDASDDSGTGVTYIAAKIDGADIESAVTQTCDSGGCELGAEFVTNTDNLSEGAHTLDIVVRDGAGNVADGSPIEFRLDRTPPDTPELSGSLKSAEGQALARGQTYTLDTQSRDSAAGLGAIELQIDDDAPDIKEQPCGAGGCEMLRSFAYDPEDYDPGPHTFTVTATDLAGNESSSQFTVENPPPEAADCGPMGAQVASPSALPALTPELATAAFRLRLPQGFAPWDEEVFDQVTIKPELSDSDPAAYRAEKVAGPMSVDRQADDGATVRVGTDAVPICTTPTLVNAEASAPTPVMDRTTTLFANSMPGTDTLIRPTPVGAASLLQIREPQAPVDFAWNVDLQPGQVLKPLPSGAVAVIEPVPEGSEIVTVLDGPPLPPPSDRRAALTDSRTYDEQAAGAILRALEEIPDEVVAVVPTPWALDALDRPVATSLQVSGSTIRMHVDHSVSQATAYPVVASHELIVADSVDEWDVLEAETNTADYTDGELDEGTVPPDPAPPEPPIDDLPEVEGDDEYSDDPSAFADIDIDEDTGAEEVEIAEASAAGKNLQLRSNLGLTESAPALLYNPRRIRPRDQGGLREAKHVRPVVPWRVAGIIDRHKRGGDDPDAPGLTPDQRARRVKFRKESKRAFKWDSQEQGGALKGWFNIATTPGLGVKTAGEDNRVVTTDVALQFVKIDKEGSPAGEVTDGRAPKPMEYEAQLTAFLNRYRSVMLNNGPGDRKRIGTLAAWNEPNFPPNPTSKLPVRAARFWKIAERLCHPEGQPFKCGRVVAGEYAGYPRAGEPKPRPVRGGVRRAYERVYENYLLNRRNGGVPRAWGWHNYGDTFSYQRLTKKSRRRDFDWRITARHYKRFTSGRYNYVNGSSGESMFPKRWLTATGVFYHRNCGTNKTGKSGNNDFFSRQCTAPGDDDERDRDVVLFGMRNQSNAITAMLRKIARDLDNLGRIYYYTSQDAENAASFKAGGPAKVPGPGARRYDSGLIGSDDDGDPDGPNGPAPSYENRSRVQRFLRGDDRTRGFSDPNEPRLAYCAFRDKTILRNRPRRCPTG